jgi:hypothetical protein
MQRDAVLAVSWTVPSIVGHDCGVLFDGVDGAMWALGIPRTASSKLAAETAAGSLVK